MMSNIDDVTGATMKVSTTDDVLLNTFKTN